MIIRVCGNGTESRRIAGTKSRRKMMKLIVPRTKKFYCEKNALVGFSQWTIALKEIRSVSIDLRQRE